MNFKNYTIKSQEAVQQAQQIAMSKQHQAIENGHLLQGIFEVDENATPFLLKKLGVDPGMIRQTLERVIESYPSVNGGNQYLSKKANEALNHANKYLKELKDEYVSIEHLLLGILKSGDQVAQLLKDSGISEKSLLLAIQELRKGKNVNSQTAEDTYNALSKYANNLNQMANENKLDPVIGRDDEIRRVLQIL